MYQAIPAMLLIMLAQNQPAPEQKVGSEPRVWSGTLIDAARTDCGPETKGAAPSGSCPVSMQTTEFGLIFPDAKALRFDVGGNTKAVDALRKSRKGSRIVFDYWRTGVVSRPVRARVTGTRTSDILNVDSVRVD